jgi:pimeloyl-ACP methyl ester carboxylesterase
MGISVRFEEIRYASSIDKIDGLKATVAWSRAERQPVLVVMHGWSGSFMDFDHDMLDRYVRAGFFVVAVGMRGDANGPLRDGSGREIYDIADAISFVRARYPTDVDQQRAYIAGWSGGGANALAAAMRFPDLFAGVAAYFPVTDYGYEPDGLVQTSTVYGASVHAAIGDPVKDRDRYRQVSQGRCSGELSRRPHLPLP